MHAARLERTRLFTGLFVALCFSSDAATPVSIPTGEYDLTTQTVLPHLEEALRYTTTHARQCLRAPDATAIFPLLQHPSFAGCSLVPITHDALHFTLQCANRAAATGSAVFEFDARHVSAMLEIRMGGKNMTLSQRLYGTRIGSCSESSKPVETHEEAE